VAEGTSAPVAPEQAHARAVVGGDTSRERLRTDHRSVELIDEVRGGEHVLHERLLVGAEAAQIARHERRSALVELREDEPPALGFARREPRGRYALRVVDDPPVRFLEGGVKASPSTHLVVADVG